MLSREKLERLVKLVLEETTEEATSLLTSVLSKYSDSEISSLLASTLSSVNSKEEVETTSEKTELVCDSTEEVDKAEEEEEEGYQPSIRMGTYTPYEEKLDLALEFRKECADVDPSYYTTKPAVLEAVKESSKAEEEKCENSEVAEEVEV